MMLLLSTEKNTRATHYTRARNGTEQMRLLTFGRETGVAKEIPNGLCSSGNANWK